MVKSCVVWSRSIAAGSDGGGHRRRRRISTKEVAIEGTCSWQRVVLVRAANGILEERGDDGGELWRRQRVLMMASEPRQQIEIRAWSVVMPQLAQQENARHKDKGSNLPTGEITTTTSEFGCSLNREVPGQCCPSRMAQVMASQNGIR